MLHIYIFLLALLSLVMDSVMALPAGFKNQRMARLEGTGLFSSSAVGKSLSWKHPSVTPKFREHTAKLIVFSVSQRNLNEALD